MTALDLVRSAESPEELAHVADKEIGYFHGGEVSAMVELGPVGPDSTFCDTVLSPTP